MPRPPKMTPPFAWLGRHTAAAGLTSVLALGALFRFLDLTTIPPGLYNTPAAVGLAALALVHQGHWPPLSAATNYAPLWVVLQALAVWIFGHTLLALRLWPAILGTLAVATTWLWAKAWFGLRIGWLTALLMAVTPWAVALSRDGSSAVLIPLLATLTLWLATRARRRPGLWPNLTLSLALIIDLLAGPLGWFLAVSVLIIGLVILIQSHDFNLTRRHRLPAASLLALGVAGSAYLAAISLPALRQLPAALGLTHSPATLGANLVKVLLMFNVSGDQNFRHNLAPEPLLNAFVGLMLVAGLLVSISRLHERRYRLLLSLALIMLMPAIVSTIAAPNAAHAAALMPFIFALSAVGISYLLELWYTTFPINSAARAAGQTAIIVLLALTIFQGYTQYFRAWASSSEVYTAYDEGAVALAHYMATTPFTGTRYVVAPADQFPVVAYLSYNGAPYQAIAPTAISTLPASPAPTQFLIAADSHNDAAAALRIKFPGHRLQPQYSTFNQAQIYYIYDTTP